MGNFLLSLMKGQNLRERISHMYIWKKDFGMKCWYERKSGDKKDNSQKGKTKTLVYKRKNHINGERRGGGT